MTDRTEVARLLFQLGTLPFIVAGLFHALAALADVVHPRTFAPVNNGVREAMAATGFGLTERTSMWLAWLGFNISHGMGACCFGTMLLLISRHDFALVLSMKPLLPLALGVSLAYLALALRFWFYLPAVGSGLGAACFALAYALTS